MTEKENSNCSAIKSIRTCTDGTLGGNTNALYVSRSTPDYDSCTLDNVTINNGQKINAFTERESDNCSALQSERTCTDGTLNGNTNALYASCKDPGDCVGPGNTIVKNVEHNCIDRLVSLVFPEFQW